MLRSFDIAVLLKLTLPGAAESSFQKLASDLHVASSEVHGAIKRTRLSGLRQHDGPKRVNRSALLDLLGHGLSRDMGLVDGARFLLAGPHDCHRWASVGMRLAKQGQLCSPISAS